MKGEKFSGKGMNSVKEDYTDLYDVIVDLNETVFTGKSLDYKTQKLIAIGIVASNCDNSAIRKQIKSGIGEFNLTKDEIVDVLRVVLLTSGMPSFVKSIQILNEILDE